MHAILSFLSPSLSLFPGPLIDLLSVADPLTNTEAMVYGLGTIKLLASNSELRDQLASAGVMRFLASTLQKCTEVPFIPDLPWPHSQHPWHHSQNSLALIPVLSQLLSLPSLASFLTSLVPFPGHPLAHFHFHPFPACLKLVPGLPNSIHCSDVEVFA